MIKFNFVLIEKVHQINVVGELEIQLVHVEILIVLIYKMLYPNKHVIL